MLVIPRYQRTYSWSRDKAEEFYDDFIEESDKAEDNLAFLGTILFAINEDGRLEVIDGQQRLITITIFLAALRDVLKSLDISDAEFAAQQIQNKITVSSTFGSSYTKAEMNKPKLQVGAEINDIFEKVIYKSSDDAKTVKTRNSAEKKVLDAYVFFVKKLKDMLNRPKLYAPDKIKLAAMLLSKINAIEYIDIRVTNKEVAYNLFESHNAKGVALAKTDLIKNYYFGRLTGNDIDKNHKMDEWDRLLDDLDNNINTSFMQPDRFFYYMVQSYEGNFSSHNLYRRIKPLMHNHQAFFKTLKTNVNLMIELKNSNTGDREIDRVLVALNEKLRVNQCFILLLSVWRNKERLSPTLCRKIFHVVEEFTYIYSGVTNSPANALEKVYSKHAKWIEDTLKESDHSGDHDKEILTGRLLKALKADLKDLKPNYNIFLESFAGLQYTNLAQRKIIRYTFEMIEYHYSKGIVALGENFTLDHIVPQKKAKGALFHSIGNLTPMSASENSAKGSNDASFDNYLDISNFYSAKMLNDQLLANDNIFDENSIQERIAYLSSYTFNEVFATILGK